MKTITLLGLIFSMSTFSHAQQGGGNGGQFVALKAANIAQSWVDDLKTLRVISVRYSDTDVLSTQELEQGVNRMRSYSCARVYLNTVNPCAIAQNERGLAQERNAVNFPSNGKIYYSEFFWNASTTTKIDREDLVAHEIFGLLGKEGNGEFTKSRRFVQELRSYQRRASQIEQRRENQEDSLWLMTADLMNPLLDRRAAKLRYLMNEALIKSRLGSDLRATIAHSIISARFATDRTSSCTPNEKNCVSVKLSEISATTLPTFIANTFIQWKTENASVSSDQIQRIREEIKRAARTALVSSTISFEAIAQADDSKGDPSDDPYAQFFGSDNGLFANSRTPTAGDLQYNQVWYCTNVNVLNGAGINPVSGDVNSNFSRFLPWYRFESMVDGKIAFNTGLLSIDAFVSLSDYQAMAGTSDRRVVDYIRIAEDGSIVGETSVSKNSELYHRTNIFSTANPKRKVIAYHICPANKRKNSSVSLQWLDYLAAKSPKEFLNHLLSTTEKGMNYYDPKRIGRCSIERFTVHDWEGNTGKWFFEVLVDDAKVWDSYSRYLALDMDVSDRDVLQEAIRGFVIERKARWAGGILGLFRGWRDVPYYSNQELVPQLRTQGLETRAQLVVNQIVSLLINGTCEIDRGDVHRATIFNLSSKLTQDEKDEYFLKKLSNLLETKRQEEKLKGIYKDPLDGYPEDYK